MTSDLQELFGESARRLFENEVDDGVLAAAERGTWPSALWDKAEEAGFTSLFADAELGATWLDAYPLVFAAGKALAPIPLGETLLAGYLLRTSNVAAPEGPLTVIPQQREAWSARKDGAVWHITGAAQAVPWGAHATHAVALVRTVNGAAIALFETAGILAVRDRNIAGEPRDTLTANELEALAVVPLGAGMPPDAIDRFGALLRATQMAGAVARVLELSVQYAKEREQFGRSIGNFQAVAHQLAVLAEESLAAEIACALAWRDASVDPRNRSIAVAKVRAGTAAGHATTIGHAIHGAMGFTHEHSLHFATRRLWAWRAEFGHETAWAQMLGAQLIERGGAELWSDLTAGTSTST